MKYYKNFVSKLGTRTRAVARDEYPLANSNNNPNQ